MRHPFNITQTERSNFLWIFSALSLCFLPLIFHFTWGNHDWLPIISDISVSDGLIEGRFSQYLLVNIFLFGKILPALNILLGFILYTAALIFICTRFFAFSLEKKSDKLFLLTIATLPYIIEILYFHFITLSLLGWPLIIVFALIKAKEATKQNYLKNTIISALLLFIVIGGYPAASTLFATATCLYIIQQLPSSKTNKEILKISSPFALSFVLAFSPIPLIYHWLKEHNLMIDLYNNEPESLIGLIQKIPNTIWIFIQSLTTPQPFFSTSFKVLTALIIGVFLGYFIRRCYQNKKLSLGFLALIILPLAAKFPAWLIHETTENYFATLDPTGFMIRIDFYALPVLLLFSFCYLNQYSNILQKNILFLLSFFLLFLNLEANYSFCKAYLLGFKSETLLLNRITERFQSHENYQPDTLYSITVLGEYSLRPKYQATSPTQKYGYYTLHTPLTRYWAAKEHYNFYADKPFAANQTAISLYSITPEFINYIEDKTALWPSEKAIYINNDLGIITLTSEGKAPFFEQFNSIKEQYQ